MNPKQSSSTVIHKAFRTGMLLKGADGVLEIIGGGILFLARPEMIRRFAVLITYHELSEDPRDLVANYLLSMAQHFSLNAKLFGSIYLLAHGLIKIMLVTALWKKRLRAYPIAIAVFLMFIAYQMYRYMLYPSVALIVLSLVDVFIVVFTCLEYNYLRRTAVL